MVPEKSTVMSLVDTGQGAFAIVQRKVFIPEPNAETNEFSLFTLLIVPDPLIKLQVPVPIDGRFADRFV